MIMMIMIMMMIMMINHRKNHCDDDDDDNKTKAVPYSDKYTELVEAVYSAVRFSINLSFFFEPQIGALKEFNSIKHVVLSGWAKFR